MRHCPLGDVAEILPGLAIAGAVQDKQSELKSYQLLQPRHIDEGGRPFVFDAARHADRAPLTSRAEKYLVRLGDVVFVARGERNRAASVQACPPDMVATGAFFVIRPRHGAALPDYLAWYLNQVPAQAAIAQARTGAGTPIVQRHDFAAINIALPPLDRQRAIAHLGDLMRAEQDLLDQLAAAVARKNRAIGKALIETT